MDQGEEVEDATILQECQKNTFVPWLQGLIFTGEAKGTFAHELEKVLLSKFGNDQDRLRDAFKNKVLWFSGTATSYVKFATVPKGSVKSKIHISVVRFTDRSFPGKGMYLADTFVMFGASSLLVFLG